MKGSAGQLKGPLTSHDASTNAANVMQYEHHEVHEGSHFYVSGHVTLGSSAKIEFSIDVPAGPKEPHVTFDVAGSTITTVELFEGTNVTGGEIIIPKNNNRRKRTTHFSSLTVRKNPTTITASGEVLDSASWGSSGGSKTLGGDVSRENELIWDESTQYLFRITSGAASNIISYRGKWYEHTPKG